MRETETEIERKTVEGGGVKTDNNWRIKQREGDEALWSAGAQTGASTRQVRKSKKKKGIARRAEEKRTRRTVYQATAPPHVGDGVYACVDRARSPPPIPTISRCIYIYVNE